MFYMIFVVDVGFVCNKATGQYHGWLCTKAFLLHHLSRQVALRRQNHPANRVAGLVILGLALAFSSSSWSTWISGWWSGCRMGTSKRRYHLTCCWRLHPNAMHLLYLPSPLPRYHAHLPSRVPHIEIQKTGMQK